MGKYAFFCAVPDWITVPAVPVTDVIAETDSVAAVALIKDLLEDIANHF